MKTSTLDRLIWILVYSGLLLLMIGLFVRPQSSLLGWALVAAGLADAATGVALIWWRSRRPDR